MTLGSCPRCLGEVQRGGGALKVNTSAGVGVGGAVFSPPKLADGYTKRLLVLHFCFQL